MNIVKTTELYTLNGEFYVKFYVNYSSILKNNSVHIKYYT